MQIDELKYYHPDHTEYTCKVAIDDDTVALVMVGDKTGAVNSVMFDRNNFRPTYNEWTSADGKIKTAWKIVPAVIDSKPHIRYTFTEDTKKPANIGTHHDFSERDFGTVQEVWYRVLEEAIKRMPQSGSKILLQRKFNDAAKELGYVGKARNFGEFELP